MAQAKTLKFNEQLLMLGDGETPTEGFAAPCGFESLNMTVNIETSTTNIPDCDDPDLPAWLASDEVSKQMVLSGEGVLDRDANILWRGWLLEGGERTIRWVTKGTSAQGGGYYEAPAILSTYEEVGQRGNRWRQNIGLTVNGKPTWTPAPAGG